MSTESELPVPVVILIAHEVVAASRPRLKRAHGSVQGLPPSSSPILEAIMILTLSGAFSCTLMPFQATSLSWAGPCAWRWYE